MSVKSNLFLNTERVPIKVYSDGSVDITVPSKALQPDTKINCIELQAKCPAGPTALFLLLSHLNSLVLTANQKIQVHLGYLPYGRQDRMTGKTDMSPFSLKTFCTQLNAFNNISKVVLFDPHSNVAESVLNAPLEVITQLSLLEDVDALFDFMDCAHYVIAPDQGAFKKSKLIASRFELPLLVADKQRDPDTKELSLSFSVDTDLNNKVVVIADDIIDYGTSIRELTSLLKAKYPSITILVFASHGILPVNERLTVPSRFSFVTEFVDYLYLHSLWKENASQEELPENVLYLQDF